MQVSSLPDAEHHPLWPAIETLLKPALSDPTHEIFNPAIDVVWIAFDGPTIFAAATTRLRINGIAELRLASGTRLHDWVGLLDEEVTAWARRCSATAITMRGRKGWGRFARPFGWVIAPADKGVFEKVLVDERAEHC